MSKSRDNKHRRQRAARKMIEWKKRNGRVALPVEIVAVEGSLPKPLR